MIKEICFVLLEHTRPTLHGLAIIRCHRRIHRNDERLLLHSVKIPNVWFGLTPRRMSADTGLASVTGFCLLSAQYVRHQPASNREKSVLCTVYTKAGINLWLIILMSTRRICVFPAPESNE